MCRTTRSAGGEACRPVAIDIALMRFAYDLQAKSGGGTEAIPRFKWFPSNSTARSVHGRAQRAVVYRRVTCPYCELSF
jgi:hypothetical protein